MLRPALIRGDEGEVNLRGLHTGKLDLRLLRGFPEALQCHAVLAKVYAGILLEFRDEPLQDLEVEIVAAEVRVPVGGFHLEDAFPQLKNRNIEGAAAEVVNSDGFLLLLILVETEGQRRRCRLVDDSLYVEPRDLAGILCGLALGVVEVGGNGDDRLGDGLAQVVFRGLLHLL